MAECLEYDIAAQARTLNDVQYEFQRVFFGRILAAKELNIKPFKDVPPAPAEYRRIFKDANKTLRVELKPIREILANIPPAFMLPREAALYAC